MRTRTSILAGVVVFAALIVFSWTLVHALWFSPDTVALAPAPAESRQTPIATSSLPAELIIPALSIRARVQNVGVNAQGNMRAPSNFTDVSWYQYGTVPGFSGSAVMAGHVDNGLGLDGVFKHLNDLKVGEDVYIKENSGAELHFLVTDIESYPYKNVPTAQIFGASDVPRLNLVTCEGTWVPGGDTYDHRLVVYTTLVGNS